MNSTPVSDTRAVAMLGHTGSGKTAVVDALLHKLGLNDRLGSSAAGSSMADYTDEEKSRKITIFAKPFSSTYTSEDRKTSVSFVDTPGYLDFFGQVVSAARAVETGLIAVDAGSGVQVGTHHAWRLCNKEALARAIVVTGLDKENTDFASTLEAIQSAFGEKCVPVVLPTADASGVVDVLATKDAGDLASQVDEIKGSLVELAAETDDTLIEKFLGGEVLSADEIASGLRAAVASGGLVPVFVVCPIQEVGVTELLDGVVRLFPSPEDRERKDVDGNVIPTGASDPLVAHVWRSVNDAFVGQLTFVRVMGGTLKADSEVMNVGKDQKERVGSLLLVNGKKQETVSAATAGDIVAIPKLKQTGVNDTLCDIGTKMTCPPIAFPRPVMFQAVTAKTQADEDKIGTALSRVCEEDPTLLLDRNRETKEMVLQGLGDVHIDVAVGLMKSRSNVEVVLSTPKVPYRETVTSQGEGHYKHRKQSGGRGQYGEVYLRVGTRAADDDEWFADAIVGGVIPGNFIPAVQKGVVEGMEKGPVAGFPVTGVKSTVYDGSYHDVDSSEIAFKIAGARALREAMSNAKPVLLEPVMTVKIMIPDHCMGDINGDLNHKRGRILGMGTDEGMQVITAEVPQAELFRYAAELRSMTAGQGSFEMEFARYETVPANVAQKVVSAVGKDKEEA